VTQTLNFGLPAPVDIQIEGADVAGNTKVAGAMLSELRHVPGLTDIRVQEQQDYPKLHINVDRTKASQAGFTEHDVVNSMLVALSGSFQVSPMYYLNPKNGVQYSIVVQNPQYGVQSDQDIKNIPVSSSNQAHQGLLTDVSTIHRTMEPGSINHYNIRRVVDIYAAVQGRDLGAVGREVNRIVDGHKKELPRGSFVTLRGQFGTMQSAYMGLIGGLIFSILLVYMLIVVNFQSWLDHSAGLYADRRQLPVLAGPIRHRDGVAGGACGHRYVPVYHAHGAERPRSDGSHHVHGGSDGK